MKLQSNIKEGVIFLWSATLSLFFCFIILDVFGVDRRNDCVLNKLIDNDCHNITEINQQACGFADVILSSLSKHTAVSNKYLSVSVNCLEDHRLKILSSKAKKNGIDFCFWQINDSYIEIEPTDLLIINALHTYHHMHFALNTFAKNVRKYIYIPKQCNEKFLFEDEDTYAGDNLQYSNPIEKSDKKGVWEAVSDFVNMNSDWTIEKQDNDYVLILSRLNHSFNSTLSKLDPKVDYYLNNKIILCTGPSLGRYQMLKETIESEMRLIPYKKIFIRTNDDKILDINFSNVKPKCERIPCIEKYVDCWNCIIASLKDAVNDPQICDDDIILFKHETVFLNDLGLFKRALNKLLSEFNMMTRLFWGGATSDIFLVKVSAIKELIQDFSLLSNVPSNEYVEMMFRTKDRKSVV